MLLDWAQGGDGAVGEDPGNYVPDAFLDLFTPVGLLGELEAAVVDGYLAGLRDGGADAARTGAFAHALPASAVKYAWLVPAMLRQALNGAPGQAYFAEADRHEL